MCDNISVRIITIFTDGSFMVALAQGIYVAQESDSQVSVCVTALSSTALLTSNVAVVVRSESGTATETGTPVDVLPAETISSVILNIPCFLQHLPIMLVSAHLWSFPLVPLPKCVLLFLS